MFALYFVIFLILILIVIIGVPMFYKIGSLGDKYVSYVKEKSKEKSE